mmetsp:Transcript_405/g.1275  ORF Transcript_405/g.1275 Transcript_405/m.1275 type:complete len:106 (-) Transcript_405:421-738(-)
MGKQGKKSRQKKKEAAASVNAGVSDRVVKELMNRPLSDSRASALRRMGIHGAKQHDAIRMLEITEAYFDDNCTFKPPNEMTFHSAQVPRGSRSVGCGGTQIHPIY